MAKASDQNGSDGEGRRLGERSGLDTRVVPAVNSASKVLRILENAQCRNEGVKLAACKYGRKTETLRNWRGSTTRGAACGLI